MTATDRLFWHLCNQAPAVAAILLNLAVYQLELMQPVHCPQELRVVFVVPHLASVLPGESHQTFPSEEIGGEVIVCSSAIPILVEFLSTCADR
jgi:hypothetical protein